MATQYNYDEKTIDYILNANVPEYILRNRKHTLDLAQSLKQLKIGMKKHKVKKNFLVG